MAFYGSGQTGTTDREKLLRADSLFAKNRFTQAYDLYSEILARTGYSASMLIKMAYISEARKRPAETLYYLNLYYLATADPATLEKMESLAEIHDLKGYESGDQDLFMAVYRNYYPLIVAGVTALCLLMLATMYYVRKRWKVNPYMPGIFFILLMAGLFFLVNRGLDYNKAIILHSEVPLMEGPSPGSDLAGVIGDGHRVDILEQTTAWTRIQWNDQQVYIRKHHLAPVKLD